MEQKILDLYNDPKQGFTHAVDILRKLKEQGVVTDLETVKRTLLKSVAYTLNREHKRPKKFEKTKVSFVCEQLQADIAFMGNPQEVKENKGFNSMLTIIDVLSKFAWVYPLKTKEGKEVAANLGRCLIDIKERGYKVERVQTDDGKEFTNNIVQTLLKDNKIEWFSTSSQYKAAVAERFNKTIKSRILKYQDSRNTWKWIDELDNLLLNYNTTKHGTILMSPTDALKKENFQALIENFYKKDYRVNPTVKPDIKPGKYQPGDFVRLAHRARTFKKATRENPWSLQIFRIDRIISNNPNMYRIIDLENDDLIGEFNEADITKYDKPDDMEYLIHEVIETKGRGRASKSLVSFLGYPDKFNKWIPTETIRHLLPQ